MNSERVNYCKMGLCCCSPRPAQCSGVAGGHIKAKHATAADWWLLWWWWWQWVRLVDDCSAFDESAAMPSLSSSSLQLSSSHTTSWCKKAAGVVRDRRKITRGGFSSMSSLYSGHTELILFFFFSYSEHRRIAWRPGLGILPMLISWYYMFYLTNHFKMLSLLLYDKMNTKCHKNITIKLFIKLSHMTLEKMRNDISKYQICHRSVRQD